MKELHNVRANVEYAGDGKARSSKSNAPAFHKARGAES